MPRNTDWNRRLVNPIDLGQCELRTLHDLRAHIISLSEERQVKQGWQHYAGILMDAASGGDLKSVEIAFRLARMMDPRGTATDRPHCVLINKHWRDHCVLGTRSGLMRRKIGSGLSRN